MTSRDERLRALEKDIRNSGGPGCQYHADQLASLIAELGQEVGAVDPVEADNAKAADRAALAMIGKGYYWNGDDWVVSTAHTSEARDAEDAARYRWLRNEAHKVKHMSPAVILATAKFDVSDEECGGFEFGEGLDKVIDAAMRQEGGTP